MIHPTELRRRRRRCRPIVERLEPASRAPRPACNVCGSARKAVLASSDRYGLAVRTALCLECGLVYLVEPLSSEAYAEFYSSGGYRELTGRFSSRRRSLRQVRAGQVGYARRMFQALEVSVAAAPNARLLDIGASTGLVANRFRQRLGFEATLLDPAAREIRQPETRGMTLIESSFDDWEADGQYELILLCRTFEHLPDLRRSFLKIREILAPDGIFFCDIADFLEICRLEGPPEVVSRIDHCFWLTQETARVFFRRMGFELVAIHAAAPYDQTSYVLRRGNIDLGIRPEPGRIDAQLRRLREIGSDWQALGRRSLDPADWLRRRAWRIKKLLAARGVGAA